jgi:hypothetical protein
LRNFIVHVENGRGPDDLLHLVVETTWAGGPSRTIGKEQ